MNGVPGALVLVVGPSGAGKDSVLDRVKARLSGNPRFLFAKRLITRPADAGGEDHEPISEDDFSALEQAQGFLLGWRAHGLGYGLPIALQSELEKGRVVVANVSRTVIEEARAKFPGRVHVVVITAPRDVLAERLAKRGRETAEDIRERLARAPEFLVGGPGVVEIVNDGPITQAGDAFAEFLENL